MVWLPKKVGNAVKTRKFSLMVLLLVGMIVFWFSLPSVLFHSPTSWVLEDNKGNLMGANIASDGQWRFPTGKKVPEKFITTLLNFEDKRFYHHFGVDFKAILRAIHQNWGSKKIISGGSTLTMQVIRLYRQKPRTYVEKLWEIILSFRLELTHSKEEILRLYAENAPFGSNIVGLEAASWRYYGRGPENLSWAESSVLAVLPNNPSWVLPGKNKLRLLIKRNHLLNLLHTRRIINQETLDLAKREPLPDKPKELPNVAPHLLQFIKKREINSSNTLIKSTIIQNLQNQVYQILQNQIPRLNANYIHNAAVLILDVESGACLAYVGNLDQASKPDMESEVDIIQARRSPGSTLKPLLYASMLNEGMILPNSLVADIPTNYAGYTPKNFDLGYDGAIPASKALSRSLNVPAVRMLYDYKYPRFYEQLKKLGITTLNQPADFYGLSLILGGEEVTLWDLCGTYASMARTLNHTVRYKGKYNANDFHAPIYSLQNREEERKRNPEMSSEGLLSSTSLWYTFQAMEEVERPGDESLWKDWSSSQRIAWKTGTSFGFRDAWAVGLSAKYVVGVWAGNTTGEGRPGLIGIKAAAPILFDIFRLLPSTQWFNHPTSGAVYVHVCKQSGYRAGEYCDSTEIMEIPSLGVRTPICPFHQLVHLNAAKTYRINSDCKGSSTIVNMPWFILSPTMEYYYKPKNPFYQSLPPIFPNCPIGSEETSPINIIYPEPMAKIYVPLGLDGKRGKVVFKATLRGNSGRLFWHLDKQFMGTTDRFHEMSLRPEVGVHTLTLEDQGGNTLERIFEIMNPNRFN